MKNKLKEGIFDKIYILHYQSNDENRKKVIESYYKIFGKENVKVFETNSYPDSIIKSVQDSINYNITKGTLGCTLGHYFIMKDALFHGYNKVLIAEDDTMLLSNNNTEDLDNRIINVMNNIPDDYDAVRFMYGPDINLEYKLKENEDLMKTFDLYIKNINQSSFWGNHLYAVSNNLMQHYIKWIDDNFPVQVDIFWTDIPYLIKNNLFDKYYILNKNIYSIVDEWYVYNTESILAKISK